MSEPGTHYLNEGWTLRSWLLTTDHKRIAWMYFATITVFFFIGGAAGILNVYRAEEQITAAGERDAGGDHSG